MENGYTFFMEDRIRKVCVNIENKFKTQEESWRPCRMTSMFSLK